MHLKLTDIETSTKTIQWEEVYCLLANGTGTTECHMQKKKKKMRLDPSIIYKLIENRPRIEMEQLKNF